MKILINLYVFLSVLVILENRSLALTNYEINVICKKEKNSSTCIKNLKEKRMRLEKGHQIEIPVIPFKE